MATIGSTNLTLVNDRPEVEVLWNGRYRLTFFCDNGNGQTDWYNENKGEIFPAFGALQSVQLGEEGAGDWIAPDGSVYDDMRLVEAGTPFVPSVGRHYVKLVYETLTSAWVAEKDDTVTYTESGLERITRTSVAIADTAYASVVGTTTIDNDGTTLYLASREIDETDAKWTLKETWAEAGKLSESDPLTGSDRLRVKTVVWQMIQGADPTGYVASAKKIDNIGGFRTITVSYYLGDDLSNSYSYATTVPFSMPGTVDFRTTNLASGTQNKMLDVTPDIRTVCSAEIIESYTTNTTVDVSSLYQPNFWTSVIIEGVGLNYQPFSSSSTYKNHIALSSGTSSTGPLVGTKFIQGNRLFGGTTGYIRIDGPGDDPAGTTITINIDVQPVFRLLDGTQYYKKVVTNIDVPARGS